MATRGRRPTPPKLRLITGTHRRDRHGDAREQRQSVVVQTTAEAFGPLVRPKWLRGAARRAWDEMITPATWLDGSRAVAAVVMCELWAEFRSAPSAFNAAKHAQLRGYLADLGLTDERRRSVRVEPPPDEFFDDQAR